MALSEGLKSFVGFFTKSFNDGSDESAFDFESGRDGHGDGRWIPCLAYRFGLCDFAGSVALQRILESYECNDEIRRCCSCLQCIRIVVKIKTGSLIFRLPVFCYLK